MKLLDKKTTGDLTKLLIFMVVTALATGLLAVTIGNVSLRGTHALQGGLRRCHRSNKGDDIRVAGVKVGTVKGVEIRHRTRAMIDFNVKD